MPVKHAGLSFERHQELGRELREMHEKLTHYAVEIGNAYPLRIKACKYIGEAIRDIDQARSVLDGCLFQEHRDQATTKIYYGGMQKVVDQARGLSADNKD